MKICTDVDLGDVMDVKFKFEKKSGIFFYVIGVKIRPFPLTLHVGLTSVGLY